MNKEKIASIVDRLIIAAILFFVLLFVIECVSITLTEQFSFDGAINVQVAQNLAKYRFYATSYDGLYWFDPKVQTGITVTLPVALFFTIFGESFESGLFVNAIYMVLLLLAIIYYLKNCLQVNNFFVLLSIITIFGVKKIFELGFGLIGEIPVLLYFFLSIIFLHKFYKSSKRVFLFFSGILLGLGFLTKTVILIAFPAIIVVAVLDNILLARQNKKTQIKNFGLFLLGFFIPVFIFEIYRVRVLGVDPYLNWWQGQLDAIFMQAGVSQGFTDTIGFFSKFSKHLYYLSSYINVNQIIILVFILLLLIFTGFLVFRIYFRSGNTIHSDLDNNILHSKDFLIVLLVTLSYLGWWIFITPTEKAWYRRIINGVFLFEFCIVIVIYSSSIYFQKKNFYLKKLSSSRKNILNAAISISLLTVSVFSTSFVENLHITFSDEEEKTNMQEVGDFIKKLPEESEYYGIGWWQSPNIAFVSGKNFKDITKSKELSVPGPLDEKYLVVDFHIKNLVPGSFESVLELFDYQQVFSNGDNEVYKLNYRK